MPTNTQTNHHGAVNGLVDLYNLYSDMVWTVTRTNDSSDVIDQFYLRGGLRAMIEKYYTLADLDPAEVGTTESPVTLERMLPRKTVAATVGDAIEQVAYIKGDLKYYSDAVGAYAAPVPAEVQTLVQHGRDLLKHKTAEMAEDDSDAIDLTSVSVTYADGVLQVGTKAILIRSYTLEDAVLDYMINQHEPEEWVHKDRIVNWVVDALLDESKNCKSVYDKVVSINNKLMKELKTDTQLFETSRSGYVKRNY